MQSPLDGEMAVLSERGGAEIDCRRMCRGGWLDRGRTRPDHRKNGAVGTAPHLAARRKRITSSQNGAAADPWRFLRFWNMRFRPGVVRGAVFAVAVFGSAAVSAGLASAQSAGDEDQLRMVGQCHGCRFENLDVTGERMAGLDLTEATIRNMNFSHTALTIAIFDFAVLENVSFAAADLSGASFRGAHLINVSFEDTDLRGAVFEDAALEETELQAGHLCNTRMPDETLDNSNCN